MLLRKMLLLSIPEVAMTTAVIGLADIENILKIVIGLVGGGVAAYGLIETLSGYSSQASGKMSDGVMKLIGGGGIIVAGTMLVSKMFEGIAI